MQGNMNTLIEHKSVIVIASQVIATALAAGAEVGADEERKEPINIQMQEIQNSDMYNPAINDDVAEEQKQPLIQK
jgi:hypothetical protein